MYNAAMSRIWITLALLTLLLLLVACSSDDAEPTPTPIPTATPSMAERAEALDRVIACPVCPEQNLAEAQVDLAAQMRQIVRDRLAEGQTDQEIIQFFKETYGPDVHSPREPSGTQ